MMKEEKVKVEKKLHYFIADPRIRIKIGNNQTRLLCVTAKKWLYYSIITFYVSRLSNQEEEKRPKRKSEIKERWSSIGYSVVFVRGWINPFARFHSREYGLIARLSQFGDQTESYFRWFIDNFKKKSKISTS